MSAPWDRDRSVDEEEADVAPGFTSRGALESQTDESSGNVDQNQLPSLPEGAAGAPLNLLLSRGSDPVYTPQGAVPSAGAVNVPSSLPHRSPDVSQETEPTSPVGQTLPASQSQPTQTPDQAPPVPEDTSAAGKIVRLGGDMVIDLVKGSVQAVDSIVGLADFMTAGNFIRYLGESYRPEDAMKILSSWQSKKRQAQEANVQGATGFAGTLSSLADNKEAAVGQMVQAAPQMVYALGAVRAKAMSMLKANGILPGTRAATEFLKANAPSLLGMSAAAEGAMSTGSTMSIAARQPEDKKLPVAAQMGAALTSGTLTALTTLAAQRIPGFRNTDVETALAQAAASGGGRLSVMDSALAILKSGFSEGVFQELPQSAQETIATNFVRGEEWDKGIPESMASGLVAGSGVGLGGRAAAVGISSRTGSMADGRAGSLIALPGEQGPPPFEGAPTRQASAAPQIETTVAPQEEVTGVPQIERRAPAAEGFDPFVDQPHEPYIKPPVEPVPEQSPGTEIDYIAPLELPAPTEPEMLHLTPEGVATNEANARNARLVAEAQAIRDIPLGITPGTRKAAEDHALRSQGASSAIRHSDFFSSSGNQFATVAALKAQIKKNKLPVADFVPIRTEDGFYGKYSPGNKVAFRSTGELREAMDARGFAHDTYESVAAEDAGYGFVKAVLNEKGKKRPAPVTRKKKPTKKLEQVAEARMTAAEAESRLQYPSARDVDSFVDVDTGNLLRRVTGRFSSAEIVEQAIKRAGLDRSDYEVVQGNGGWYARRKQDVVVDI